MPELSLVIPVYNEEENLPLLMEALCDSMKPLNREWEAIFVDDGSTDRSQDVLKRLVDANPEHVRAVIFRRNFGQTAAIAAGIDHSRGSIIILLDADLQNDPADIPVLLDKLDEGDDLVSGWRKDRQDNRLTRTIPSNLANGLISHVTGVHLHDYGCSLKVVVPRLRQMPAGKPRTWTFAFLHLGLLLLAAGLALDGLSGFVGTHYFAVGVPYSGYHNWRTGRDETFPFAVEVVDAKVRYHPLNLQIGVKDASGNKVGLFVAREGTSFPVGKEAILLTPRKFDVGSRTLHLDAADGGRTVTGLVATADAPASVSGYAIVPVAFADPEPSDYVARVRFTPPGRPPEVNDI